MASKLNLIGARFGRLLVVGMGENTPANKQRLVCKCDCGADTLVVASKLTAGKTVSCGCSRTEAAKSMGLANRRHGHRAGAESSPTYISWEAMIRRCEPSHKSRASYFDKGVSVCDRWRSSFEDFLSDMGERPEGKTIDRYPNQDGNYEPGNCRWATDLEQQRNRRNSRRHSVFGLSLTVAELSERFHIPSSAIKSHIYSGKSAQYAVIYVCTNRGLVGPLKPSLA